MDICECSWRDRFREVGPRESSYLSLVGAVVGFRSFASSSSRSFVLALSSRVIL